MITSRMRDSICRLFSSTATAEIAPLGAKIRNGLFALCYFVFGIRLLVASLLQEQAGLIGPITTNLDMVVLAFLGIALAHVMVYGV